jgi:hypothetical protein
MDVLTTLRVCVKRWYVFVPVLLLGVIGTVAYASSQKPTWSVTQHLLVVPPSTSTSTKAGQTVTVNPFGGGPNAARLAAAGMASALQSKTISNQLKDLGSTATYTVKVDKTQPLVDVTVVGAKRADVEAGVQGLTFQAVLNLHSVQQRSGSPATKMLQAVPSIPGVPLAAEVPPTRTKGVVALSLLSLFVAALAAILAERILSRRERSVAAYPAADAAATHAAEQNQRVAGSPSEPVHLSG